MWAGRVRFVTLCPVRPDTRDWLLAPCVYTTATNAPLSAASALMEMNSCTLNTGWFNFTITKNVCCCLLLYLLLLFFCLFFYQSMRGRVECHTTLDLKVECRRLLSGRVDWRKTCSCSLELTNQQILLTQKDCALTHGRSKPKNKILERKAQQW